MEMDGVYPGTPRTEAEVPRVHSVRQGTGKIGQCGCLQTNGNLVRSILLFGLSKEASQLQKVEEVQGVLHQKNSEENLLKGLSGDNPRRMKLCFSHMTLTFLMSGEGNPGCPTSESGREEHPLVMPKEYPQIIQLPRIFYGLCRTASS